MKSGLLWFDKSPGPITQKIQKAARRYQQKYGVPPTACFLNPVDAPSDLSATALDDVKGICIQTKLTILPNHIWLGVTQ